MIKALLLLLKFSKLGKILLTSGTMLLSVIAYAWVFGWRYAVGFVLLIFVHEMGHYIAARRKGLDVGAPTFIPFVGAWIQLKQMPHDAETLEAGERVQVFLYDAHGENELPCSRPAIVETPR